VRGVRFLFGWQSPIGRKTHRASGYVAARVEQLTKTTGDAILLTQRCVDTLASRPPGLIDRGFHVLKGKSAAVQVFGLDQETDAQADLTS